MTARKTAARRVTAALAAAAVAFSGAVLLAPSASAATNPSTIPSSGGLVVVSDVTVDVTILESAAESQPQSVTLTLFGAEFAAPVSATETVALDTADGTTPATATVSAPLGGDTLTVTVAKTAETAVASTDTELEIELPAFTVNADANSSNTDDALVTLGGVTLFAVPAVVTESSLELSVNDASKTVTHNATVDVVGFNLRSTVTLVEDSTVVLTLENANGAPTWSGKPTVQIGNDRLAARNVTVNGSTLTLELTDEVSAGTIIFVSGVKVKTVKDSYGVVTLRAAYSGEPGESVTAQYFTVANADLSFAAVSIAKSTLNSITYASIGAITLTVRETVTNPVLVFTHDNDDAEIALRVTDASVSPAALADPTPTAALTALNTSSAEVAAARINGTLVAGTKYRITGVRLAGYTEGEVAIEAQSSEGTTLAEASSVITVTSSTESRIAGADRYQTSALLAVNYWQQLLPTVGSTVIVANGENAKGGADALSASFLSGAAKAPVVLVSSDAISASVLVALKAQAQVTGNGGVLDTIYVLGIEDSVSASVVSELEDLVDSSADVVRIGGSDRFATSALVAEEAIDLNPTLGRLALSEDDDLLPTAFVANGWNAVDALFAASLAYNGFPVLLTNGTGLNTAVANVIEDGEFTQAIVLGAEASVSEDVVDSLEDLEVDDEEIAVSRVGGATRFDTAAELNTVALDGDLVAVGATEGPLTGSNAFLFDGFGFADALSGGAYVGILKGVLVPTWSSELAGASKTFLSDNSTKVSKVTALGGTDRVDSTVLEAAVTAAK